MSLSSASYVAWRAAQEQKVRLLYRRSLRDTLNWAVHRHLFYSDADELRKKFDASSNVDDLDTIDSIIADGEAEYNKWRHPDPYLAQNLGYPHGEPMLHRHGRAKAKRRRRSKQQSGTGMPCQMARSCLGRNFAAFLWRLGFCVEDMFSAAVRVFQGVENPTLQTLYKEGQT